MPGAVETKGECSPRACDPICHPHRLPLGMLRFSLRWGGLALTAGHLSCSGLWAPWSCTVVWSMSSRRCATSP